ncbi:MAG: aminoacyl-tRNA hydrolase [Syntrophales bacterium]
MKLIVGLGNPGEQYRTSRHNLGFLVLDQLAGQYGISLQKRAFDAFLGKGRLGSGAIILAKPQTYMNLSGNAVQKLVEYFKIDVENLIIIHDDLDLPFQTLRLKKGGGDGGHKGLASIIQHLGSSDFLRVRIGIGKPLRKTMVESYVLAPFSKDETIALPRLIEQTCEAVRETVLVGIESAMRNYHGKSVGAQAEPIIKQ